MTFIIKFVKDNRIMIVCNADKSYMTFSSEAAAQKMSYAFEEQYPEIHWVVPA